MSIEEIIFTRLAKVRNGLLILFVSLVENQKSFLQFGAEGVLRPRFWIKGFKPVEMIGKGDPGLIEILGFLLRFKEFKFASRDCGGKSFA